MSGHPVSMALWGWAFAVILMFVLWIVQRIRNDAGVVDVGWTAGVGALAVAYAALADGWEPRRWLVAFMAGLWSFRLAGYIVVDRIFGKEEDGRYQRLRALWGERAHRNFLLFFEAQSPLVVLFSLPMLPLVFHERPGFSPFEIAGVVVWAVSIAGETIADLQLAAFRRNPANQGTACREGLWRYSRHPNYFFEWIYWWSWALMGIGAPWGWLAWIGPVLMLVFLFRITGIPHTETQALASRGDDYRRYQEETSIFVPWFPKTRA